MQRVFSLPFRVTISMSHAEHTQQHSSFWKTSFFSHSIDESLTDFEKRPQEQFEQLALQKSSFLFRLFDRLFSRKSFPLHLSNGPLLCKAAKSRSGWTQQSSSRDFLLLWKYTPVQRGWINLYYSKGRAHHCYSRKILFPTRILVG